MTPIHYVVCVLLEEGWREVGLRVDELSVLKYVHFIVSEDSLLPSPILIC